MVFSYRVTSYALRVVSFGLCFTGFGLRGSSARYMYYQIIMRNLIFLCDRRKIIRTPGYAGGCHPM